MAKIEEKFLQVLRDAGLYVSHPYSSEHGWPDGVGIGKPVTRPGNAIQGYRAGFIVIGSDVEQPPEMDAPMVVLYSIGDAWIIHAQESVPKLGPGDFINDWPTPDKAIEDIFDFYFGDSKRMKAKAEARKKNFVRSDKVTDSTKRVSA